jgi:hypothetical protein
MADTPIQWHDHVLIARRPHASGPPLTGTAVGRWITPSREPVITVILDAPDADGRAILDVFEAQLVVIASERNSPRHGSRHG